MSQREHCSAIRADWRANRANSEQQQHVEWPPIKHTEDRNYSIQRLDSILFLFSFKQISTMTRCTSLLSLFKFRELLSFSHTLVMRYLWPMWKLWQSRISAALYLRQRWHATGTHGVYPFPMAFCVQREWWRENWTEKKTSNLSNWNINSLKLN